MSHTGVVRSFGAGKGFGFITCETAGGDVYFHRSALPEDVKTGIELGLLQLAGRTVSFELGQSPDGKPQAKSVQVHMAAGEPVMGSVKSYSDKNGFGFLVSSSFPGADVYFHRKEVPPFLEGAPLVGTKVRFVVHPLPDGKNQARQLTFAVPETAAFSAPMTFAAPFGKGVASFGKGAATSFGKGVAAPFGKGAVAFGKGGAAAFGKGGVAPFGKGGVVKGGMVKGGAAPAGMMSLGMGPGRTQELTGVVKMFNDEKGFGFITSPNLPGDVYFKAEPGTVVAGEQQVAFALRWSPSGQPQAADLRVVYTNGEVLSGTVKSFVAARGYGFVAVSDRSQDVYFQTKDLPQELQEAQEAVRGATVRFTLRLTKDGRPQMQDAELLAFGEATEITGEKRPFEGEINGEMADPSAKRPRVVAPTAVPAPALNGGAAEGERAMGFVKTYNATKGFGFIESADVAGDVYFQTRALPMPLQQLDLRGRQVSFELKRSPDGKPQGMSVQVEG